MQEEVEKQENEEGASSNFISPDYFSFLVLERDDYFAHVISWVTSTHLHFLVGVHKLVTHLLHYPALPLRVLSRKKI